MRDAACPLSTTRRAHASRTRIPRRVASWNAFIRPRRQLHSSRLSTPPHATTLVLRPLPLLNATLSAQRRPSRSHFFIRSAADSAPGRLNAFVSADAAPVPCSSAPRGVSGGTGRGGSHDGGHACHVLVNCAGQMCWSNTCRSPITLTRSPIWSFCVSNVACARRAGQRRGGGAARLGIAARAGLFICDVWQEQAARLGTAAGREQPASGQQRPASGQQRDGRTPRPSWPCRRAHTPWRARP